MPCCPCIDNMARSFLFTIGSPLQLRHKWTAKTRQDTHTETTQPAVFYIWPNDIDECKLVRFHHVESFWIKLKRFQSGSMVYSKYWIFGHMEFHNLEYSTAFALSIVYIYVTSCMLYFNCYFKVGQDPWQLMFTL